VDISTGGRRLIARALLVAVLVTSPVLAACGAHGTGSPSASPSTMSDAQLLTLGRELAQCIRDHGVPGLPDPNVENGRLILPSGATDNIPDAQGNAAMAACQSVVNRIPASALGDKGDASRAPVTAADVAKMRQYAQCMRQHGLADFPDPTADGVFDLAGTSLANDPKSQRVRDANDACLQYETGNMQFTVSGR
jgi:hypothetical protein